MLGDLERDGLTDDTPRGPWMPGPASPDLHLVGDTTLPPPVASLGLFPFSLSVLETIQLYDFSYDPGQIGIASRVWDFGDGTSAEAANPTHRYTADGDYRVELTVTTADGRRASTAQVVRVRTHDIGIARFTVPTCARVGQTVTIAVGIVSGAYDETVRVHVRRRGAAASEQVGAETLRAHSGAVTSTSFPYTFSPEDARAGTVVFEAVATIVGARDASPDDNAAVAPTIVVS
jgi:PKD repeat protein